MNKSELIAAISEKAEIKKVDAEKFLAAFIDTVSEQLKEGTTIQLVGFGTFETAERAARVGKNPQTGAEIQIPASVAPKFKPGKALKDLFNVKEEAVETKEAKKAPAKASAKKKK